MKNKKGIICSVLILISVAYIAYSFMTPPRAMRGRPPSMAPAAGVYRVETGSVPIYLEAVATLIPYQNITLKSKVSGRVESLSEEFEIGSIVKKGTVLFTIEKRDYENEVKKLEASLAKARADYSVELGHQKIVQEELKQLEKMTANDIRSSTLYTELTLRKPQLQQVLSDLSIAEANLNSAKYDLEETEVKAPFDALILSRSVSIGQHISASEASAELVSVDKYLADVSIPVDALYNNQLLSNKNKEVPIIITTNYDEKWDGKLEQVVSALTTESRMGKLIVSIEDPLALDKNSSKVPLLLGDQVNVNILAGKYDDVVKLPRSAVYNNENIWVVDENNTLKYQAVDIVWSDGNNIYIRETQLKNKSLVLNSGINNPVENLVIKPNIVNLTAEETKAQDALDAENRKAAIEAAKNMPKDGENARGMNRGMRGEGRQREGSGRIAPDGSVIEPSNAPQRRRPPQGEGIEGERRRPPQGAEGVDSAERAARRNARQNNENTPPTDGE